MGPTTLVCTSFAFLDKSQLKKTVFAYDHWHCAIHQGSTIFAHQAKTRQCPGLMSIEWRESFCTGIPGVDHEHRQIVSNLNQLIQRVNSGCERQEAIEMLDEVYADIGSHFALEEEMMRRHSFHEASEHAADHHRLLDEIRNLTQQFEQSAFMDTNEFEAQLSDWFGAHFSTYDARLHREAFMEDAETNGAGPVALFVRHAKDALLGKNR